MSKIFENYQNPGYSLSFKEVKDRIEELTTELRGSESYYRRHQLAVLTKEQREDILLENEIQDEIDFYEAQIHGFRDQEDVQEHLIKIAGSHFNNDEEDEQPHYHINDYCDPYLGRESPPIPMLESSDEEEVEEPKSKINVLQEKLDGVEDVVYQLLGGLFNQTTQSEMIDLHLCSLRGTRYLGNGVNGDTIWPTTRQGDQHEEEIKLLKQQVSKLEDTVALLVRVIRDKM